jgi:hypothetical protein
MGKPGQWIATEEKPPRIVQTKENLEPAQLTEKRSVAHATVAERQRAAPAKPTPVEVRIGTIEVRVSAPPSRTVGTGWSCRPVLIPSP